MQRQLLASGMLKGTCGLWTFEETDDGTGFTITHHIRLNFPFFSDYLVRNLFSRLIIEKAGQTILHRLKAEAEDTA